MGIEVKKEKKAKKTTDAKQHLGRIFANLGQIVFATMFLGSVIQGEIPHYVIMLTGFIGAVIFIFLGVKFSEKEIKEKEE